MYVITIAILTTYMSCNYIHNKGSFIYFNFKLFLAFSKILTTILLQFETCPFLAN